MGLWIRSLGPSSRIATDFLGGGYGGDDDNENGDGIFIKCLQPRFTALSHFILSLTSGGYILFLLRMSFSKQCTNSLPQNLKASYQQTEFEPRLSDYTVISLHQIT